MNDAQKPSPSQLMKQVSDDPRTRELEENDPRHAAARRFARLAVNEIKLYQEEEVKAGLEHKDLWARLRPTLYMAIETYDGRVEQEVRDRFDYLYDEIVKQLANGDAANLGPDAPAKAVKPPKTEIPAPDKPD
jgi:hypothetical protein